MSHALARSFVVVATAVAAGLAVWGLSQLAGVDLSLKEDAPADEVGIADVLGATIFAGFAAWAVHGALVHFRAARFWPVIGSTALSISIIGPVWMADGESAVALIAMHFAVGLVLIMGFGRFVGCEDDEAEETEGPAARPTSSPYSRMR